MSEDQAITLKYSDLRRCLRAAYQTGKIVEKVNNASEGQPGRYGVRVSVSEKKGSLLVYLIDLSRIELEDQPGRLLGYAHINDSGPGDQILDLIIKRIHELKLENFQEGC